MIRLCLLLLAFICTPLWAADKPPILSEADRPNWLSIGRVNIGGFKSRGVCTGTLIAPDQVITAAHCVSDPKTGAAYPLYRVFFVAGWHKGTHVGTSTAREIQLHPGYGVKFRTNPTKARSQLGADLALITLKDPLEGVTPARISKAPRDGSLRPVRLLGYRGDRENVVSDYSDCVSGAAGDNILGLTCDVAGGTSGAPVFAAGLHGWEVIGVISSRVNSNGRIRALAAQSDLEALAVFKLSRKPD